MAKRTIPPITAVLLCMIGFASGLHTQLLLQGATFRTATGCFPFGLWQALEGKPYGVCCAFAALSVLLYASVMLCGALSWFSFPVVPAALFALGFKLGVALAQLSNLGFWQTIWLCAFCLSVLFAACALACAVLDRRIYHIRRKLDFSDRAFLIRTLACCACFGAFLCVLYIPVVFLPFGLHGLFDSVL